MSPQEPPTVRFEPLFRALDGAAHRLDRALHRLVPPAGNPLAHTGALANLLLVVAVVSGVVLLWWYVPSVSGAYSSVATMHPLGAGLVRSVHRYSSDAAMFLVLAHAAKLFFARRFTGPRWLAWVTGWVGVLALWAIGWSGYWLVWDEAAAGVALGTARLLDVLPIFADPLSRGFLVDRAVSSLLFFVVFFAHMLLPFAMVVALWLHVARVSRPKLFPDRSLTTWTLACLLALSVALPADHGDPSRMTVLSDGYALDAWYLAPVWLTDRLGAGALWSMLLLGGPLLFAVPWWLARPRPAPAAVDPDLFNACRRCVDDCPYDAIRMVDGVATVDAAKCVSCGVCAGSCNSAAIGLPWLDVRALRAELADDRPVLFACERSAGGELGADDLPGWRLETVPCAGWLHAATVERPLRHGAPEVVVVACEPGACASREGSAWTALRLAGAREPAVREARREPIRFFEVGRTGKTALLGAVHRRPERRFRAGALVALAATAVVWVGTRVPYAPPTPDGPELVVSFKHPGAVEEGCRTLTEAELAALPVHMRAPVACDRARSPVRLRVTVDGEVVHEQPWRPRGLWEDGNSLAVVHVPVGVGQHRVEVALGERAEGWDFTDARTLSFAQGRRRVALYGKVEGWTWE